MYHFSRGYRCFGEEGALRLNEMEDPPKVDSFGVTDFAAGDLNGDGADELVVAFAEGQVYCFSTTAADVPTFLVRLGKGVTGPVTVSAWQGEDFPVCVGTWTVGSFPQARGFTLREAGECTLRWSLPGRLGLKRTVVVAGDHPVVTLAAEADSK